MGEPKRRREARKLSGEFTRVDDKLRRLGVDVSALGFYDQPAFQALEETDPLALELYSSWVINRPRDLDYDAHARLVVPRLAAIIERRLASANGLGACVNVATMMARMLDRLGVWSFAVRGSLTVEIPSRPEVGRRYFPECDLLDHDDNVTGHGWLVAPPFVVVDPTLKHQKWVDLDPEISALLPEVVAADGGGIIRPRWNDVVSDALIEKYNVPRSELNADLPYRFKPDLVRIQESLPGREVRIDGLSLRYIAGAITVSDRPLEEMPWVSPASSNLRPIHIWDEDVASAFCVAKR
jgi:hypothetical protein